MPTKVSQNFIIKTADGQTIVLSREEASSPTVETKVEFICDGPRCAVRHNADAPVSFSWDEQEIQKDPLKLPDYFFGFIPPFLPYMGNNQVVVGFCGPQCLRDWLVYSYIAPKSPRAAIEEAKKQQEAKLAELNPHLVQPTGVGTETVQPSAEDLDAVAREQDIAVLTQADGYAGDPGDEHP